MEQRPDPDELLKHAQSEEMQRGKLKIFLGYVTGVIGCAHVLHSPALQA